MGLQFFPHLRDQCVLLNARGKVDGARTPKRSSSACVYDEQAKCARYYIAVLKANSVRDQLRRHEPFQFFTAAQHSIQRFFFGQCDDDYVALFFFLCSLHSFWLSITETKQTMVIYFGELLFYSQRSAASFE